ncbi:N-6 DNA methylase [Halomicroarcula sp. S1AR25-4]|uniref:Eco57I restriction-modification methylase domain-containing protein n=1 Tax=Haloarcula sp. S1AR25-4 TaxID=2950538 RepID=UPI002876410E|nr:N-6 DNA methylase [Halomicroarcula sp. S1AR25-4]MDS0280386.1 N-6 DNA methylase [Halomicroarcula sp. S1AR25-4]
MSQATLGSTPYRNSSLFSGYYLDERIDDLEEWECDEEAHAAYEELQQLWELEGELVPGYKEDELLDSWIDEVLDILGFGTQSETTVPGGGGYNDRLLFDSVSVRREAAKQALDGNSEAMYGKAAAVLEAKQWDADFTKKFDEHRSYRDASHQIKYYLEHTPEQLRWGVLTDGRKWRLYGTKDYATEIYYEVDLPELLEADDLERFKYFYAFFRPQAFRETAGTSFLDQVWNESETAAQELGEDLQDNVFTALRVLGEGFIHTNDLDIDPDDAEARAELKEQSLVLLYRLMFVLYAESRGLIHPDDPSAEAEYEENFSLDQLRQEIHEDIQSGDTFEDYSGFSTSMWGRLDDLFSLVDEGEESLGIPPYNGGLFDSDSHEFLAENEVSDRHIAEVIYRLGTTENDDDEFVLADYADLDTRHLGSIYEGLLEHEFRIADEQYAAVSEDGGQVWKPATEVSAAEFVELVEPGELYVVNDDGERKATGAYYTPDYVVSYIVEETIDPLLDDIKTELEADGLEPSDQAYFGRFYGRVQELKILDPAMGSAHFLTSATAYLTEQVMEVVREQEEQGRDEQEIRRTIAKECIYGVDINGMAVELGKLSMWLETLAADKPLAFLDHHIKDGNSLVGSDITDVLSDGDRLEGQITLTQVFARARQQTLQHVMDLMQDLLAIDNEALADIKSMEELYDEIRADPLYQRLFEVANVHTAEQFNLDVPEGVYEEMAGAIDDGEDWDTIRGEDWFTTAQSMADDETFFHWELEFPEVFFDEDGEKLDGAGFDAVVGNPPYIPTEEISDRQKTHLKTRFDEILHRKYDLSVPFLQQCYDHTHNGGYVGMITPVSWETGSNYEPFRSHNFGEDGDVGIQQVINLPFDVFEDAYVDTTICIFTSGEVPEEFRVKEFPKRSEIQDAGEIGENLESIDYQQLWNDPATKVYVLESIYDLMGKYGSDDYDTIGDVTNSTQGPVESHYEYSQTREKDSQLLYRELDVYRYSLSVTDERYIYMDEDDSARGYYTSPRVLIRRLISRDDRVMAMYETDDYVVKKDLNPFLRDGATESLQYLLANLNSTLHSYLYINQSSVALKDDFRQTTLTDLRELPYRTLDVDTDADHDPDLPDDVDETIDAAVTGDSASAQDDIINSIERKLDDDDEFVHDVMVTLVERIIDTKALYSELNTDMMTYFGEDLQSENLDSLEEYTRLSDLTGYQPPSEKSELLTETTGDDYELIEITGATVEDDGMKLKLLVDIRTREDSDDDYDYHDDITVATFLNPDDELDQLLRAFLPEAIDRAEGYADFRDYATSSRSTLEDRVKNIRLPDSSNVSDDVDRFLDRKEEAALLAEKISRCDDLIDRIVYLLYDLSDEQITRVEERLKSNS